MINAKMFFRIHNGVTVVHSEVINAQKEPFSGKSELVRILNEFKTWGYFEHPDTEITENSWLRLTCGNPMQCHLIVYANPPFYTRVLRTR